MAFMTLDEMRKHEWVVAWSGGKDSTATIILCHEHNIPIKEILYVRMMYDNNIPATLPIMNDFVECAKDVFKSWGYKVRIVPSVKSAEDLIFTKYKRSPNEYKNGNPWGITAFMRGRCRFMTVKQATFDGMLDDEDFQMIGYGIDEPNRYTRLSERKQSIMCTLGLSTKDAFNLCLKHGLLSPLYDLGPSRDGCWFCPNANKAARELIKEQHPHLLNKIKKMIEVCPYDIHGLAPMNTWLKDYYDGKL